MQCIYRRARAAEKTEAHTQPLRRADRRLNQQFSFFFYSCAIRKTLRPIPFIKLQLFYGRIKLPPHSKRQRWQSICIESNPSAAEKRSRRDQVRETRAHRPSATRRRNCRTNRALLSSDGNRRRRASDTLLTDHRLRSVPAQLRLESAAAPLSATSFLCSPPNTVRPSGRDRRRLLGPCSQRQRRASLTSNGRHHRAFSWQQQRIYVRYLELQQLRGFVAVSRRRWAPGPSV